MTPCEGWKRRDPQSSGRAVKTRAGSRRCRCEIGSDFRLLGRRSAAHCRALHSRREGLAKGRLTWTDALVAMLAQAGFDRRYGARPLQRTIERMVVTPLSRYLLEHPRAKNASLRLDVNAAGEVVVMGE